MRKTIVSGLLIGTAWAPLHAQDPAAPAAPPVQANPGQSQSTIIRAPAGSLPPGALVSPGGNQARSGPDQDVVVQGSRPRGSVTGNIPPETVLTPLEIRARGAGNLAELLQSLEPQTRSTRGREDSQPVVLINGRRVSSFAEVANIPPEAIERTEIFPEELALRYGYRADQKVVNVVLFERYRFVGGQASYGGVTAGGRATQSATANYLSIQGETRWNVDLDYQRGDALYESERNLRPLPGTPFDLTGNIGGLPPGAEIDPALSLLAGAPVTRAAVPGTAAVGAPALADFVPGANLANQTDVAGYRTLLPATERFSLNTAVSRNILGGVAATLNFRFEASESDSALGLSSAALTLPASSPFSPFASDVLLYRYLAAGDPLRREVTGRTLHAGTALSGRAGRWLWSFTGNYDRVTSRTLTDTGVDTALLQARITAGDPAVNPFADFSSGFGPRDVARSVNALANADLVFSGALFRLPAGEASASVRGGFETLDFRSETTRQGVEQTRTLSRDRGSVQASLDLPIASRATNPRSALGNLSINLNAELAELSDFGTLRTLGYGLVWSPVGKLDIIASVTDEDGAPTVQQLGDPVIATPNVRTFDFVRGETVDITRILGGNPDLVADNRHVFRLGLNLRPIDRTDLTFSANYVRSRIDDPIAFFPAATPAIEAAFPDRFTRDADGRLRAIDSRPVNFARWARDELRLGINFTRPLANLPQGADMRIRFGGQPPAPGQLPANLPPGAIVRRIEAGSPEAVRMEGLLSRFILSFYHTWRLQDEILTGPGGPRLDLLDGAALGNRGGTSRHEFDLQAGIYHRGLGARLTGNWRSGTVVRGLPSTPGASGDLSFSDYGTVSLNLFADLGQRFGGPNAPSWMRGLRLSLGINNLFDARPQVRDAAGVTPVGYQPDYLDPLGRSVLFSIRKRFS